MTTRYVDDPDGSLRTLLLARLEHNVMTWSDRVNLSYTEEERQDDGADTL